MNKTLKVLINDFKDLLSTLFGGLIFGIGAVAIIYLIVFLNAESIVYYIMLLASLCLIGYGIYYKVNKYIRSVKQRSNERDKE